MLIYDTDCLSVSCILSPFLVSFAVQHAINTRLFILSGVRCRFVCVLHIQFSFLWSSSFPIYGPTFTLFSPCVLFLCPVLTYTLSHDFQQFLVLDTTRTQVISFYVFSFCAEMLHYSMQQFASVSHDITNKAESSLHTHAYAFRINASPPPPPISLI